MMGYVVPWRVTTVPRSPRGTRRVPGNAWCVVTAAAASYSAGTSGAAAGPALQLGRLGGAGGGKVRDVGARRCFVPRPLLSFPRARWGRCGVCVGPGGSAEVTLLLGRKTPWRIGARLKGGGGAGAAEVPAPVPVPVPLTLGPGSLSGRGVGEGESENPSFVGAAPPAGRARSEGGGPALPVSAGLGRPRVQLLVRAD